MIDKFEQAREIQLQCSDRVTAISTSQLKELDERGLLFTDMDADGKVNAVGYLLPLTNTTHEKQVYRIGGLAVRDYDSATITSIKAFIRVTKSIIVFVKSKDLGCIMQTRNKAPIKDMRSMGVFVYSYDELFKKYPGLAKAYACNAPDRGKETPEYLRKSGSFYVYGVEQDILQLSIE